MAQRSGVLWRSSLPPVNEVLRPLIVDGVSLLKSYKKDFAGVEQKSLNGNILPLALMDCIKRGHKITVVINMREIHSWSNNDFLECLNVDLQYCDHFAYKQHLIETALLSGGFVISNDSFRDIYNKIQIRNWRFPNVVVKFSINYVKMESIFFTYAFQTGVKADFHLYGRNWFSRKSQDRLYFLLAWFAQLKPHKQTYFSDKASKWLAYYNFKIYQHLNIQRQNYMGLRNDVPLPKSFRAFCNVITKKLTILETIMEEEET